MVIVDITIDERAETDVKIAVYGATGAVGRDIVAEAAARGHEVSAFSRHQADLPEGLTWQHGDLADTEGVRAVAASHDAVVTANGPSREPGGDPNAFAGVIAGAASVVGSTRLVVVGGAGSLVLDDGSRLVDSDDFPAEYRPEALASAAALAHLRASDPDLDWTYLSPAPAFPVGERVGSYVVGDEHPVGGSISGPDFAAALLDELERPAHRRARFTVAAPPD